jgi:hypothetical protein
VKGAVEFGRGKVGDQHKTALNGKSPVVDGNDLTQLRFASNQEQTASNGKKPITDASDLTQSSLKTLEKWGGTKKPAPVTWAVHHMLQADAPNYIAGEPGVGKSWIMCDLAVSVATGTPFLGRQTQQGPVLIINFDDTETLPRQYAERTARARHYAFADLPIYYWEPDPDEAKPLNGVLDADVFEALAFHVEQLQPKLIILDSFSSAFPGLDGNKGQDIVRMHEILRQLRIKSPGACLVLIDHTPKEVVLQSKRRGVSGSQQKNGQVRSGHIVSRIEPSEVGGRDVLRWDFHKLNAAPPQKSFAIEREQTLDTACLIVSDLPEHERAPKTTQALTAALTLIRSAGDEGIARTELIEQVATIANVSQRTVEGAIDKEVRSHPNVFEKQLPGRGKPKGYKWRGIGADDGGSGGADDSTQNSNDLTQTDNLAQTPIALNQGREGRENTISRNGAKGCEETPLREKIASFWPSAAEHPYTLEMTHFEYLRGAIFYAANRGRQLTDPLAARHEALAYYLEACTGKDCAELRLKPDDAPADEIQVEAMTLYGAARELQATERTEVLEWAQAAEELVKQRQEAN